MKDEKEILTILSKNEYDNALAGLERNFPKSKHIKRLAIQCTDVSRNDLDTRIRITNGKVQLMQKKGQWKSKTREEIEVDLASNPELVLKIFRILRNTMQGDKVRTSIIQTDSLVFENKDFEIKLTHQFGKSDKYNAEIEVFDAKIEPEEIAEKFDIPVHLPEHTATFWDNWSRTVNFCADKLSEKKLLTIIKKYLDIHEY